MSKGHPDELASPKVDYPIGLVCHISLDGVLFGPLCHPLGSPLVTQALLSGSLGSRLVASAPHRCDLAPLKVPSSDDQNVHFY